MEPETAIDVVLYDGGTLACAPLDAVPADAWLACSFAFAWIDDVGEEASLDITFARLNEYTFHKLHDDERTKNALLIDIVDGIAVAIVVEVYLDQCLRFLAEAREHSQNDALLLEGRRFHL